MNSHLIGIGWGSEEYLPSLDCSDSILKATINVSTSGYKVIIGGEVKHTFAHRAPYNPEDMPSFIASEEVEVTHKGHLKSGVRVYMAGILLNICIKFVTNYI